MPASAERVHGVGMHCENEQTGALGGQTLSHAPQWYGSFSRFTHESPQQTNFWYEGHVVELHALPESPVAGAPPEAVPPEPELLPVPGAPPVGGTPPVAWVVPESRLPPCELRLSVLVSPPQPKSTMKKTGATTRFMLRLFEHLSCQRAPHWFCGASPVLLAQLCQVRSTATGSRQHLEFVS